VLRFARRAYRALFPRLRDPLLDGAVPRFGDDERFEAAYNALIDACDPGAPAFIRARYAEGQRWRSVMSHYAKGGRILDVGGGDGAIELAFAADPRWFCVSVNDLWNDRVRLLRDATGARVHRVVADAARLPFRDGAFAAVTCFDTVEHFHEPRRVGDEVCRVSAGGAVLLLTTTPRLRWLLRPDPHFGIWGLLLLPARMQRAIAARRGFTQPDHYVDRIYTSARQLGALFRAFRLRAILSRSRAPRRWFFDAIVYEKR
jgi:SAM-dependent methyltransferase